MELNPASWILRSLGYNAPPEDATERVALAIGLDPSKLKQELRAHPSLAYIAADQDIPVETLKTRLSELLTQKIELAVSKDELTPQEADELRKKAVTLVENMDRPEPRKRSWRSVPIFGIIFVAAVIVRLLSK